MISNINNVTVLPELLIKRKRSLIIISLLLVFIKLGYSQYSFEPITITKNISWKILSNDIFESKKIELLNFEGATYEGSQHTLPIFNVTQRLPQGVNKIDVNILNVEYENLLENERRILKHTDQLSNTLKISSRVSQSRGQPYAIIRLAPILRNNSSNFKKVKKLTLEIIPSSDAKLAGLTKKRLKKFNNSELSSGEWYRLSISHDGIHKISYELMKEMGINVDVIDPRKINVYGNGIGMLPEENNIYRHDDLKINSIYIKGEEDGSFDPSDYILFFAKGPHTWMFDTFTNKFVHKKHLYSDVSNYFLSIGNKPGKRVGNIPSNTLIPNYVSQSFDDFKFHEIDKINLIKSGREWYGEDFNIVNTNEFGFNFPNSIIDSTACLKTYMIAKTIGLQNHSSVDVFVNGTPNKGSFDIQGVAEGYLADKGRPGIHYLNFKPTGDNFVVNIRFNKFTPNSEAWLNYLELNVRRKLNMAGSQMIFRDIHSVGSSKITKFQIGNPGLVNEIWDITEPTSAKKIQIKNTGSQIEFVLQTDSLREFVAFSGSNYFEPKPSGKVSNQNLHGLSNIDLMIVTHPLFINQANELAQFHKNEGLTTHVATNQQVYNEFSSGTPDITAIKDLMRMLYEKAGTDTLSMPKYLLLFGDGSYDNSGSNKDGNSNYVLTYQSPNSYSLLESFVSDDYFGLLDKNESSKSFDLVDIGIGRFPVSTVEEAQTMIDKIKHYSKNGSPSIIEDRLYKDWRNSLVLIADDGDSNRHLSDAEDLAKVIEEKNPQFNIKKVYLDSYQQEATAGGEKYPDVNREINDVVKKGALIINYTGHGGELGWAHEQILDNPTILGWENLDNMPVFFTATCEFSRYDDPDRTSAGEYVILNPKGGGVALLTTTRLVFASPNAELNKNFYLIALNPDKRTNLRLGDLNRITKFTSAGTGQNRRNFSLLGDPALKLNYPKKNIITSTLNGKPIDQITDTISALSTVTITGYVADLNNNKLTNFNGIVYPTVFDKPLKLKTLGQDDDSYEVTFLARKNIIYKGKATVRNGDFSFTFTVPRDINYEFGFGRISYYAFNGNFDASGYNENFLVGGSSDNVENDVTGPTIELYLNDENFINGSSTDEKPVLLANIWDQNGINTVGSGIGHDITTTLDERTEKTIVLNDFYEADLDTYQSGKVKYQFSNLEDGEHSLKFKIWDIYNNSSEKSIDFVVAKSEEMAIDKILNYPNPFVNQTSFYFEHNQPNKPLNVRIQIFTISGKLVKTLNTVIQTNGFKNSPINWNGTDDFGDRLGRGVYLYKVKVTTEEGQSAEELEKLVILN